MGSSMEPGGRARRFADRDLPGDVLAASGGGKPVAIATLLLKQGKDVTAAGKLFVETDGSGGGTLGNAGLDPRARSAASEVLRAGNPRPTVLDDTTDPLAHPVLAPPPL